jgi:hypothetical protein
LLFFALVAIIVACVCLWFEMQDYASPNQKPWDGVPSVSYQAPGPSLAWTNERPAGLTADPRAAGLAPAPGPAPG